MTKRKIRKKLKAPKAVAAPKIVSEDSFFDDSFQASFGSRIKYGLMPVEEELKSNIKKTSRADYGRVIDIRVPHGFHAQVKKSWEMYETDRLFRYLIERCIDYGVTGFEWHMPERKLPTRKRFWEKLQELFGRAELMPQEKEKMVWDTWAARVNENASNVLQGIDEINQWIFKHFLLGAMAPLEWQWEKIKIDDVEYELPMKITTHNPLSIILDRKNVKFTEEETYVIISTAQKRILETNKNINQANFYSASAGLPDRIKLNQMGESLKNRQEVFVLKLKWSPGDNTSLVYGRDVHTGQGLYPTPPFVGLYETLILRRQLHAADVAILDGIIHFIIDWEIGDDTKIKDKQGAEHLVNQPRPARVLEDGTTEESTISLAKKIITSDTRGPVMQIFHPYYFKFNLKMPEVDALINSQKYDPSTFEVYQAFGILLSGGKGKKFAETNTQNFEALLENFRQNHIKRFWESLCIQIIKRNQGKLTIMPNFIWDPLSTKDPEFKTRLLDLAKTGKVSTDTLLAAFGLDKKYETMKIAREVFGGEKELFDKNVPVSFVQAKVKAPQGTPPVGGTGEEEEEEELDAITPLQQPGRPRTSRAKKSRKNKEAR